MSQYHSSCRLAMIQWNFPLPHTQSRVNTMPSPRLRKQKWKQSVHVQLSTCSIDCPLIFHSIWASFPFCKARPSCFRGNATAQVAKARNAAMTFRAVAARCAQLGSGLDTSRVHTGHAGCFHSPLLICQNLSKVYLGIFSVCQRYLNFECIHFRPPIATGTYMLKHQMLIVVASPTGHDAWRLGGFVEVHELCVPQPSTQFSAAENGEESRPVPKGSCCCRSFEAKLICWSQCPKFHLKKNHAARKLKINKPTSNKR